MNSKRKKVFKLLDMTTLPKNSQNEIVKFSFFPEGKEVKMIVFGSGLRDRFAKLVIPGSTQTTLTRTRTEA